MCTVTTSLLHILYRRCVCVMFISIMIMMIYLHPQFIHIYIFFFIYICHQFLLVEFKNNESGRITCLASITIMSDDKVTKNLIISKTK